jgi:hypothetical protein
MNMISCFVSRRSFCLSIIGLLLELPPPSRRKPPMVI